MQSRTTTHRISTKAVSGRNDAPESVFLSLDWINRVAERVEASRSCDPHFRSLVADISLTVVYIINGIPTQVAPWYGNGGRAILAVRIREGAVEQIDVRQRPPRAGEADVVVTTEYEVAKRLLVGELRPASAFVSKGIQAKPSSDFRGWPVLATKSVLVAGKVLRMARRVPTEF